MFVIGNFINASANLLDIILTILYFLILFRAIISWVSPDPFNPIVQSLHRITDPILEPIRRLLPPLSIDFSPLIAFFGIIFLKQFLVATLHEIAMRF